jgi:hypothetical protein
VVSNIFISHFSNLYNMQCPRNASEEMSIYNKVIKHRRSSTEHTSKNAPVSPSYSLGLGFLDEACFTRDGVFNLHNACIWNNKNPYPFRHYNYQQ